MPGTRLDEKSIFNVARQIESAEAREAYLQQVCEDAPAVADRVRDLLRGFEKQHSFLESPAAHIDVGPEFAKDTTAVGTQIGPYKLVEQIGEGGMGVVYLAEQERPFRRRVALKIVKPGMDTREVIGRFEAERQALALMDHPNIAKVFDAGTTEGDRDQGTGDRKQGTDAAIDRPHSSLSPAPCLLSPAPGRPYFVMELVQGVPITEYCDECQVTTRDRLDLFITVCRAVQHAHQKGIIHRDIKPTNVLVAIQDGRAMPKIIDFGVAKAIGGRLTDRTLTSGFAQMLGTPLYMSPEQAELSPLGVDTRSDVYSLGVLIYELLTGATPFDKDRLHTAPYDEVRRIIREEEPPRPSIRLSTLAADAATTIATRRRTDTRRLVQTVRGELDWIVMKALDKDRNRRYETANDLARDVERYLANEPVHACPTSAVYRLQKLLRKHRRLVAAAAGVLAALVVGMIVAVAALVVALRERQIAEERRSRLEQRAYATSIALAQIALANHDTAQAQQSLSAAPRSLRGWEWDRLWWIADRSRRTLLGHVNSANAVAYSPDGEFIASVGEDSMLCIWDAKTGDRLWTRDAGGPRKRVVSLAFSPNAKWLLTGGSNGTVTVWDMATRSPLWKEPLRVGDVADLVRSLAFSPDNKAFATGDYYGTLSLWRIGTDATVKPTGPSWRKVEAHAAPRAHVGVIWSVAFSDDGKSILSAGADKTVIRWRADTGEPVQTFVDASLRAEHGNVSHRDQVTCAAFDSSGNRVISGSKDRTLKFWDTESGELLKTLDGHENGVNWLVFSPDGERFATVGNDDTLRIWDAHTGVELAVLHGHTGDVLRAAYSADGRDIVTCGHDGTLKIWNAHAGPAQWSLLGQASSFRPPPRDDAAFGVVISRDGQFLVSCHEGGLIKRWDAQTGEDLMNYDGHDMAILAVAQSSDGKFIASGGNQGTLRIWQADRQAPPTTRFSHWSKPIRSVVFSPDGLSIAAAGAAKVIEVWRWTSDEEPMVLEGHTAEVTALAFSPDGRWIASCDAAGEILLWDAKAGRPAREFAGHDDADCCVAFNHAGTRMVSGGTDKLINVWEMETGRLLQTMTGHAGDVLSVAWSPDGTRIVSGSRDGTVKLWNPRARHALATLRPGQVRDPQPFELAVHAVCFSPNGETIFAGVADGSVQVWESSRPEGSRSARHTVRAARELVDELVRRHGLYRDVIDQLTNNAKVTTPELREVALRIAKARRIADPFKLTAESFEIAWRPGDDREKYRPALEKSRLAVEIAPNNRLFLFALAVCQYRMGDFDDALETLRRADAAAKFAWDDGQPGLVAVLAMTQHQLGQVAEAKTTLERLRAMAAGAEHWGHWYEPEWVRQAEVMIAGPAEPDSTKQPMANTN